MINGMIYSTHNFETGFARVQGEFECKTQEDVEHWIKVLEIVRTFLKPAPPKIPVWDGVEDQNPEM